jgi:CMD domain protein
MSQLNLNQPGTVANDLIDLLAGILPNSPAGEFRGRRADVAKYVQASYEVLLEPQQALGLSPVERTLAALRVAILVESSELAEHYRLRLQELGTPPATVEAVKNFTSGQGLSKREAAILRHTDLLTLEPAAAGQSDIAGLQAAGLTAREVVTLAQLVAFLSFQVRLLAVTKQSVVVL